MEHYYHWIRNMMGHHSAYTLFLLILQHLRTELCLNHENSVCVSDKRNCIVSMEMRCLTSL